MKAHTLIALAALIAATGLRSQTIWVPGGSSTGVANNTTNSNVGIGTSSPTSLLELVSTTPVLTITGGSSSALRGVAIREGSTTFATLQARADTGELQLTAGFSSWGGFQTFHTDGAERLRITSAGKVGIGTTSPATRLSVVSADADYTTGLSLGRTATGNGKYVLTNSDNSTFRLAFASNTGTSHSDYVTRLAVDSTGNVGIGTAAPEGVLEIIGSASTQVVLSNSLRLRQRNANGDIMNLLTRWSDDNVYFDNTDGDIILRPGGNVGIGTVAPTHKLAVNGTVRAKEVIVDTGWADHVFADDYRLAPLDEVEAHIQQKRHLPGIPSAAEVAANGISVGEMQAKLLEKVEELTLHLIVLKKENRDLAARVQELERSGSP